jgi:Carboxypeptidase regulatory-like domain/TonB dependent receptor
MQSHDTYATLVLCLLVQWFSAAPSLAQETTSTSLAPQPARLTSLHGYVYEPGGHIAKGARVTLVHWRTRFERVTKTDSELGHFVFDKLPFGDYALDVELPPYKAIRFLTLTPQGEHERLHITLKVAFEERHVVSEPLTLLSSEVTTTTFSQDSLESQPLINGRTLQVIQALAPGIVITESLGTLAQFTAAGQRRFANRLTIDGASADLAIDTTGRGIGQAGSGALPALTTVGSTQTLVPVGAIQEIQVRTTNAAPEHARTPGAQTSIITRAGSDTLRGWGFLDARPNALAASDWFVNAQSIPRRETRAIDFGESLGGPLVRKRAFFFAAAEFLEIDRPVTATTLVPSLRVRELAPVSVRPVLDAFPLPNGPEREAGLAELSHQFPVASRVQATSLRVDVHASNAHQAFLRVHQGVSSGDELSDDASRLPWLSFNHRAATSTRTLTAGLNSSSSTLAHDLRANITEHRGEVVASPASYGGAQPLPATLFLPDGMSEADASISLLLFPDQSGQLMAGRTADGKQRQFQFASTLSYAFGSHALKLGASYIDATASTSPTPIRYTYRFLDVGDFLGGRAWRVVASHRRPAKSRRQTFALFIQDTWQLVTRASLNYGLRFGVRPAPFSTTDLKPTLVEFDALPDIRLRESGTGLWKTRFDNMQAHVSLAALLGRSNGRETGLRAGFSLVYDDLTSPGASAFGRAYPYVWDRMIGPTLFPIPESSLARLSSPTSDDRVLAEYFAIPEDLDAPLTREWQVGLTQTFGRHHVEIGYVGTLGRRLIYWQAYRPLNETFTVQVFSNDARSDYHAMLTQYRHPLARGLQAQVNYTWSHAIDTDSGESLQPYPLTSFFSPESNRGNADFDRRHVLRATLSYRVPSWGPNILREALDDWQIDLVGTAQSGAPISVTTTQLLPFGLATIRPDIVSSESAWVEDPSSPTGARLNPAAFVVPAGGARQGTLGRNTFRGTPLRQLDLALSRSFRFRANGYAPRIEVRIAAFNVLNVPNFGPPDGDLFSVGFGRPTRSYAEALGTGTLTLGGLVPIHQAGGPRAIQLGFRFRF